MDELNAMSDICSFFYLHNSHGFKLKRVCSLVIIYRDMSDGSGEVRGGGGEGGWERGENTQQET